MAPDRYANAEKAFIAKLRDLTHAREITVRGLKTKELESELISITHPEQRCYFVQHRNDNIFAKIAETLWMLAGRDDIGWLSYYLPRAAEFSDNGRTWRGAYGPRIRNWNGCNNKVDQLNYVHTILNLDPFTRQGVISIWDPSEDTVKETKDRPCNCVLQFYARDNYNTGGLCLNMNITQRSCDLLWGYSGIDTFSWSVLQQMVATWVGMQIGYTNHFITSLHLYEQHWKRADKIAYTYDSDVSSAYDAGIFVPAFSTALYDLDDKLKYIFMLENVAREDYPSEDVLESASNLGDEFLSTCSQMLFAYVLYTTQRANDDISYTDLAYVVDSMPANSDFRLAAIEYFTREDTGLFKCLTLTEAEARVLHTVYNRI